MSRDTKTIIVTGAGGVGKTTISAAMAVRMAGPNRRTVVMTVDPARRLADALDLHALSNEPTPVPDVTGLWASTLDASASMGGRCSPIQRSRGSRSPPEEPLLPRHCRPLSRGTDVRGDRDHVDDDRVGSMGRDRRRHPAVGRRPRLLSRTVTDGRPGRREAPPLADRSPAPGATVPLSIHRPPDPQDRRHDSRRRRSSKTSRSSSSICARCTTDSPPAPQRSSATSSAPRPWSSPRQTRLR